jgi:CubicO group peptidase (beta-lactamase class C family)
MTQLDSTKINDLLASVTSPSGGNVSGVVFQAVDKNGNIIASGASGVRNKGEAQPMTTDTVFWIASCTKLVTSIALMQLVEQGKVNLDDADIVAKVLPEVAAAKVFHGGVYKEQEERITLRMLVTHTGEFRLIDKSEKRVNIEAAGFSYTFLWEDYWKSISEDANKDEFSGNLAAFVQPLKNQPGKGREYSVSPKSSTCKLCRMRAESHSRLELTGSAFSSSEPQA